MRSHQLVVCIVIAFVALAQAQFHHPSQFRPSPQQGQQDVEDATPAAAGNYRQQSAEYEEEEEEAQPTLPPNRRQQFLRPSAYQQQQQQHQQQPLQKQNGKNRFEDELEVEEPDRLALFLEKSNFQCEGRTGYYADESVNCEVFHYCQENQKHSWVCPEGFVFHQVHLICMPPSTDNICTQSSKYHIVNDFLYKPINTEEHETRPNVSLKYSERYYPEDIYHDERQDQEDEEYPVRNDYRRQPIQVGFRKSIQQTSTPSYRQAAPQQQQSAPTANVYRSSDDINIPLQQRRPQIVLNPTTARYHDDEYNYEK